MKNKRPVFKCKECKWLNRVPSLFDGIEVLECSNGNHNTINLTDVGGGCTRKTSPRWCPLKEGADDRK